MQVLAANLQTFMREELAANSRPDLPFVLMHDGAAAAATYAGETQTVVLMLGTAIGNGFPPVAEAARPLHPEFVLL